MDNIERANEAYDVLPEDRDNSVLHRAIGATVFAATAVSWGFELSPANEAFRGDAAFSVLERVNGNFIENGLIVGSTVTALTFAIEMVPSSIVSYGINREGSLAQRYVQRKLEKQAAKELKEPIASEQANTDELVDKQEETKKSKVKEKMIDFSIAMSIGAAAVVAKRHLGDKEPSSKKDMKNAVQASRYVAAGSGVVGFLAGGGIQGAADLGFEDEAQWVINHGTDWKTWAGFFVIVQGGTWIKNGISAISSKFRKSPIVHNS